MRSMRPCLVQCIASAWLCERGFQVVYPLGLWSRFSGVVNSDSDMASKLFTFLHCFPVCFKLAQSSSTRSRSECEHGGNVSACC